MLGQCGVQTPFRAEAATTHVKIIPDIPSLTPHPSTPHRQKSKTKSTACAFLDEQGSCLPSDHTAQQQQPRAFSSREALLASREENAMKQKTGDAFRFTGNAKCAAVFFQKAGPNLSFLGGLLFLGLCAKASALPVDQMKNVNFPAMETTPVVVFGKDSRRTVFAFAQEQKLDPARLQKTFAGSGLIECGKAHGAGQLTVADNLVTTAAHVFYDEKGKPRAKSCNFVIERSGKTVSVPIDLSSLVAGSTDPYSLPPVHDWAVARLSQRVAGVTPYELAEHVSPNTAVEFVARGHIDWGGGRQLSMEKCFLHDELSLSEEGTREFSFDCETGDGASGGAVIMGNNRPMISAILVGWRSNKPLRLAPFSTSHYNFVVTIEGAFKEAVIAAAEKANPANKMVVEK
jgi:hypothetical protein